MVRFETLLASAPLPWGNLSMLETAEAIAQQRITSEEVVTQYLTRINSFDKSSNPALNAVVHLHGQALNRAQDSDRRIARGDAVRELEGVPFLVKDNIAVAGMPLTCGNINLRDFRPTQNAEVINRLIAAGAIPLASANTAEFAHHGTFTTSSSLGRTGNAFNSTLSASGSSGGSAVGLASGFAAFALGTDSCGSITGPAAHAGLVGYRPSQGMVSNYGVAPLSPSQDMVGPLTYTVHDALVIAEILLDGRIRSLRQVVNECLIPNLNFVCLDWVLEKPGNTAGEDGQREQVVALAHRAVQCLQQTVGMHLIDIPTFSRDFANTVLSDSGWIDCRESIEDFVQHFPHHPHSLDPITFADLVAGTSLSARTVQTWLTQEPLPNEDYERYQFHKEEGRRALIHIMDEHRVDVIAHITSAETATTSWAGTSAAGISANTGAPALQIPIGATANRLPVGLTLVARPGKDEVLFAVGQALEQALTT
ncbi:MAG: amidase [Rothia sp. (in: high G+C Gram-positive bacteria)]|nr:amidase [Rothia sp. (in: high G+C Gram-positive bacteria)]